MSMTRNGVSFSEALQEAAVVAHISVAVLATYEFWHESFAQPIRVVDDVAPFTAALEIDAPRDSGLEVEFLACPMEVKYPEESDSAANPTVSLSRADVAGVFKSALDLARGSLEPWTIIERVYTTDDTSQPAKLPPRVYEVNSVDISGSQVSLAASYSDHANESVPRLTFRRNQYPGLAR